MEHLTQRPNGFVLITGPTGSGKSTTLAAFIDLINSERDCHIITVEDPIEYLHTQLQQARRDAPPTQRIVRTS